MVRAHSPVTMRAHHEPASSHHLSVLQINLAESGRKPVSTLPAPDPKPDTYLSDQLPSLRRRYPGRIHDRDLPEVPESSPLPADTSMKVFGAEPPSPGLFSRLTERRIPRSLPHQLTRWHFAISPCFECDGPDLPRDTPLPWLPKPKLLRVPMQ